MGTSGPLPREVRLALMQNEDDTTNSAGFDERAEYCWAYCTSQLFIWPLASPNDVKRLRSALPITGKATGVIIKSQERLIVCLVSQEGNICYWPMDGTRVGEVMFDRVPGRVVAVTSTTVDSTAFLVLATDNSSLHVSAITKDATVTSLRRMGGADGDACQSGFLGWMGSKVPLVGGGKASAAVALHAEESRSDPGWLDLLVLTRKDLTCWQTPSILLMNFLWSSSWPSGVLLFVPISTRCSSRCSCTCIPYSTPQTSHP